MKPALAILLSITLHAEPTATCAPSCVFDGPIVGTPYGLSYSAKGQPLIWTVTGLDAGAYIVDLTFVESVYQTAGQRPISVTINDSQFLSGFDIFAAGGFLKPVARSTVEVPVDGRIVITIRAAATAGVQHAAILSGLAVRPVFSLE